MARRLTRVVLVPMTPEMADLIQDRALRDERPVAAYVRRLLAQALAREVEHGRTL